MNDIQDLFYDKIMQFQIGSKEDNFPFIERLSNENLWSREYAGRCIDEYKKFLYLAMISEKEVTPSGEVDQVWHLHLLYTKSYWSDLCQNILGTQLHHTPTKGGVAESSRFEEQYQYTTEIYRDTFGEYPPTDIWPNVEVRFQDAGQFIRVNRDVFCIRKKLYKNPVVIGSAIMLIIAVVIPDSDDWMLFAGAYVLIRMIELMLEFPKELPAYTSLHSNGSVGGSGCGGCGCG